MVPKHPQAAFCLTTAACMIKQLALRSYLEKTNLCLHHAAAIKIARLPFNPG